MLIHVHSPRSVEQVQGVIKIAREFKIPLWTFSRGKNLGYVCSPLLSVVKSTCIDLASKVVYEPSIEFGAKSPMTWTSDLLRKIVVLGRMSYI